jgi:hypothetical protein
MTRPIIRTPRGQIFFVEGGTKAELTFNPCFGLKWSGQCTDAQRFLDGAVLHNSEKFIPLRTGMLIKSGIL